MAFLIEAIKTVGRFILRRGSTRSYSQFGEDAVLQSMLKKKSGVYVDVGAFHPILYSNTYALYRRGWRGIAIDPSPLSEKLFKLFRSRDTFVRCGVGKEGTRTYYVYSERGYNTFDEAQARAREQIKRLTLLGKYETPVRPLSAILTEHGVKNIDFLNVDAEGMDLEILKTHDWTIHPEVIAVEGTIGGEVHRYLAEKGYELVGVAGLTLLFKESFMKQRGE